MKKRVEWEKENMIEKQNTEDLIITTSICSQSFLFSKEFDAIKNPIIG